MPRAALAAVTAFALALAAVVAPATIAPVATASAAVSGSGTLFPTGGSTCGPTDANPCRAALEWRTNSYGPNGPGETQVKRRTMFSVYAVAGEQILVGSSSMQTLSGSQADIVMWNPGLISETGVNTVANSALPTPSFSCLAQRATGGDNADRGVLATRTQELAGPNSITGNNNAAGYKACYYTAPTTGIYRVAFYGTAGNLASGDGSPSPLVVPSDPSFPNPAGSSAVNAWDLTVRGATTTSTTNIAGRVYTYSFAFFTGANPRPVMSTLYLNTTDGFRYRVDMRGLDGNGYAYYGNRSGFLDADGTPLNHDVVATGSNTQILETLLGGTHLAAPEYPLSLEPLSSATLGALSIPTTPTNPVLNSVSYAGKKTASGSYVDQGGTFTVDTGTSGTYEIVLSRDGVDFDPGLPGNVTIRGVVDAAGVYAVNWDGKDNRGNPFPIGDDYVVHATLRGGEYHAPMLDIESSYYGGPTITLENPPSGICPFTGATSNGSNCTRAFFDDRGYTTSSGVNVGTPGGAICPNFAGVVPNPLFSDPVTGFDSSGSARAFGTQESTNANAFCPTTKGTLGDAKGLDIWTFFPSAVRTTQADVLPLPTTPDAVNDSATTSVGTTLTRGVAQGVLGNDSGTNITVTAFTPPSSGTLTIAADGSYSYVPTATFTGTVTSTYTITDDAGQTDTAVLTITVTPRAVDDTASTPANTPVSRTAGSGVLANDVGTGLTVTASTPLAPGTGTLTLAADGSYSYTPPVGFSGTATTSYTVRDSSNQTTTATLTITVTPIAVNDTDATDAGTPISRNAAAGVLPDDSGTDLEVTAFTPIPAGQGTLTIAADGAYTFTPAAGFSGDAVSTYTITDAAGSTTTATLTITVRPVAVDDSDTTAAGATLTRDAAAGVLTDDLGTGLQVTAFTAPASGSLNIAADGSYSYTPAAGFSGDVTSDYTVTDAAGRSTTATLTITVTPLAVDDTDATPYGQTLTHTGSAGVLGDDLGTGITVTGNTPVSSARGTLTIDAGGSYVFVPAAGFSGVVSTVYTIRDTAGRTATATLTIAVGLAAVDDEDTTPAGTPLVRDAANGVLTDDGGTGLEVTAFTSPSSGTLSIAADGSYSYTPAAGFSGTVSSMYTVTDDDGQTDTAVLTLHVTPVAVADTDTTTAGAAITRDVAAGVLADDRGTGLTVTSFTTPSSGSLSIQSNGSYTYTPAAGFSGTVVSTYTVADGEGQTTTSTLTITVAPLAVDDTDATSHGTSITRVSGDGVLGNDLGTGLQVTGFTSPSSGSLSIQSDGSYTYAPVAGFSGVVSSVYTITDANGLTDTATLTISVTPVATNDTDATTAGTAISRDAAAGVLPDDLGSALTVTGFTAPASGTLSIAGDGSYDYTPAAGFSGTVTSTYTVRDSAGQTTTATLTITVTPVAVDDADTTTAGTPLARGAASGVLPDDLGSGLTVTGFTAPASGTLSIASDGSYDYTPAVGFSGTVSSVYTVRDSSGQTTTATLTITVTPVAVDDVDATTAGTSISRGSAAGVLVDDSGSGLQVTGYTAPASGTVYIAADGAYDYTPAVGFSGTVSSVYTVRDSSGQTTTATLTITVSPVAVDDTDTTTLGTAVARDAAGGVLADDLGSGLTVTGHTAAAHGSLAISADGAYTYTPDAGFSGTDSVVYTVRDTSGQTTTATLVITVAPAGGDDVATTPAGTTLVVPAPGVLDNDAGTGLSVTSHTQPASGAVAVATDGSYSYTPPAGFSGVTTFTYDATDGASGYTQTVTITVTPVAVDDTAEGDVDEPITLVPGDLLGDDLGTGLAVTGATDGAHGTVVVAPDGTVTYTPESGFSGQDIFTYTITGAGGTATASVTVLVRPSAPDDEIRTKVDERVDSVSGRLLANARGTGLTVHGVTQPAHGTVVVDADGTFHYTPAPGYSGTDLFTYSLMDAFGTVVTGTVRVTVVPALPFTGADPLLWTGAATAALLAGAFLLLLRRRRGRRLA